MGDPVQRARFCGSKDKLFATTGKKIKDQRFMGTINASLGPSGYERGSEGVCPTQTTQRPIGRVCTGHSSCLFSHLLCSHGKYSRASPGFPVDCRGTEGQVRTFSVCYISYNHHRRGTREQGFPAKPLLTRETHQPLLSCLL